MRTSDINIQDLAATLRAKRGTRGLRSVADEITKSFGPVSFATLARVEQGKVPDLDTYIRLCRWLGVSTERFAPPGTPPGTQADDTVPTVELVTAHLRADRALDPETADALVKMIRLAYAALPAKVEPGK